MDSKFLMLIFAWVLSLCLAIPSLQLADDSGEDTQSVEKRIPHPTWKQHAKIQYIHSPFAFPQYNYGEGPQRPFFRYARYRPISFEK